MAKKEDESSWLKMSAKIILTTMLVGLMSSLGSMYSDIQKLNAKSNLNQREIEVIEKTSEKISRQVDDLHWYLIRSKHGKIKKTK